MPNLFHQLLSTLEKSKLLLKLYELTVYQFFFKVINYSCFFVLACLLSLVIDTGKFSNLF